MHNQMVKSANMFIIYFHPHKFRNHFAKLVRNDIAKNYKSVKTPKGVNVTQVSFFTSKTTDIGKAPFVCRCFERLFF